MNPNSEFEVLRKLSARLPFGLFDVEDVNRTFQRWREEKTPEAGQHVDLWTYCYVRRYFLVKFTAGQDFDRVDFDMLISRVFNKIQKGRQDIRNPESYASWVSVVCKNTFVNYANRRRFFTSIDHENAPVLVAEGGTHHDIGLVRQMVEKAIDRLPSYLQEVARLRLLEDRSYERISKDTGRKKSVLRSYVCKALKRLRNDPQLATLSQATPEEHRSEKYES